MTEPILDAVVRKVQDAEVVWSRPWCPVLERLYGWGARVFILRDRLAVTR